MSIKNILFFNLELKSHVCSLYPIKCIIIIIIIITLIILQLVHFIFINKMYSFFIYNLVCCHVTDTPDYVRSKINCIH